MTSELAEIRVEFFNDEVWLGVDSEMDEVAHIALTYDEIGKVIDMLGRLRLVVQSAGIPNKK